MPRRTNTFQRLITLIHGSLEDGVRVEESAMLRDKVTEELREVDVLISFKTADYPMTIGVEVVAWKRPADVQWVERMWAKHQNLDTDKLVLVSENGFTKTALEKARFYNLEAVSLETALEVDWSLFARLETEGIFELNTVRFECGALIETASAERQIVSLPLRTLVPSESGAYTVEDWTRHVLALPQVRETFSEYMTTKTKMDFWLRCADWWDGEWMWDDDSPGSRVVEIHIGVNITREETPITYAGGKFRNAHVVTGISTASEKPLQLVWVKRRDGRESGWLSDANGIRRLTRQTND